MGIGAVNDATPQAHAGNSSTSESETQFSDVLDQSADSKDASSTQYSSDTPDSQGAASQSCIDPALPTAREESMQRSLPEEERYLPPGAAPLQSRPGIPSAEPGTNFANEASRG